MHKPVHAAPSVALNIDAAAAAEEERVSAAASLGNVSFARRCTHTHARSWPGRLGPVASTEVQAVVCGVALFTQRRSRRIDRAVAAADRRC